MKKGAGWCCLGCGIVQSWEYRPFYCPKCGNGICGKCKAGNKCGHYGHSRYRRIVVTPRLYRLPISLGAYRDIFKKHASRRKANL